MLLLTWAFFFCGMCLFWTVLFLAVRILAFFFVPGRNCSQDLPGGFFFVVCTW
jgi:hypothetical protein